MSNAKLVDPELPLPRYGDLIIDRHGSCFVNEQARPKHQMVESMKPKCPTALGLPEPLRVGYQEEVRDYGNLYVHTMYAMGKRFVAQAMISDKINIDKARWVRARQRKKLIRRFWRTLGAA